MKLIKDITYGTQDTKNQILDMYIPDGENVADVLIYFHGGGLISGDKTDGILFEHIVNAGIIVISANYRMYPDAKYPEFVEDAASVVHWVKENINKYRKVRKLFVGGSSAGAYMTAMLAYAPQFLDVYGIKTNDIDGYVINSAQMTTHFNVLKERGINSQRIVVDEAAPVYHISENTKFPNALVIVSDNDIACRLEQNLMFLKTASIFGCPEEKMIYKLMKGFSHCGYDKTEEFADLILEYMNSIN